MELQALRNDASAFKKSAERSLERRPLSNKQFESFLVPAVVNLAFSIELYLKFLLAKKGITKKTHELLYLFDDLDPIVKQEIIKLTGYDEEKFELLLCKHTKAYNKWRYFYEQNEDIIANIEFLKKLADCVESIVNRPMNDTELDKCLNDCWDTVRLNFRFLTLGHFFSVLSRRLGLSRISPDFVDVHVGSAIFRLSGKIIREYLQDVYSRPEQKDTFSYLTLIYSVRGIMMGVTEGMKNEQLKKLVEQDIFKGDKMKLRSFEAVTKFMRNVLSHNYRDQISLVDEDYARQKKWWFDNMHSNTVEFKYDYSDQNSVIYNPEYTSVRIDVVIDWNSLAPGMLYGDVVDTFQNFMMAEFCYNVFGTLYRKRNP